MSINLSKRQVLHITRAKCPIQTKYILHGTVLESIPSAKYLGVTISDNLSWSVWWPPNHGKETETRSDGMATSQDPLAWGRQFCKGQWKEQEGEEDRRRDGKITSRNGREWGLSASSVNLHDLANTIIFHNNLRVMLSPLKLPVLRKYSNPFKRPGMYPSISKCNAKRCNCCMHLCTNSTVTSSVNGRKFSVVNNSDLDWKSKDLIYVLTWKTKNCNMQYVGQTCRALQKRFGEHYRRMKKPKPIDTFLYQHFKRTGHSPNDV